ncbi:hypothetical protein LBMAG50_02120 [Phycisphaerae bacterium]|nr:hypothetical protein LBMAG50_02120 [Phycisphaerae bacterium]
MLIEFLNPKLVQRLDPSPEINSFIRSVCQEVSADVGLAETTLEQAFLARMRSGAVSTPEGVAFLHAVVVGAKQTVVGCCVMPKGLLLDYTNPPADIIFTLVGNSATPWQHVRLLARLSRIASDGETRKRLKSAATGADLLAALLEEDKRHG